jgi:hypothetical protein
MAPRIPEFREAVKKKYERAGAGIDIMKLEIPNVGILSSQRTIS